MSRRRQTPCPTPSKGTYHDEDEAAWAAQSIAVRIEQTRGTVTPMYVYRCACGRYHLTHHSMSPDSRFQRRVS